MSEREKELSLSRRLAETGPPGGGAARLRRLHLLGLVNGGIFLAALGLLAVSVLPSPSLSVLAVLGALLVCAANAMLLRRRAGSVLAGELAARKLAEQKARAAELTKGRLLAELGHEIRNPMNGILGMTELLLLGELAPPQREQVALVRTSAEALLGLVNGILDLSRIEAGRLVLKPCDFRLREVTGDVIRLLAPRAAEKEVELRLSVAPALPDDLLGDPVRLRQVLFNLVSNAIRFTRKGSVTVTVEPVKVEQVAAAVRYEVRDTGVGIRPEVQDRLFEPFTQSGSSVSRPSLGTGLGLVLSKSLVELMGGEIGFASTRGVGSTFWFRLPLAAAHHRLES